MSQNSVKSTLKQHENSIKSASDHDIWLMLERLGSTNQNARLRVERESPETWNNVPVAGPVAHYDSPVDFKRIQSDVGGGSYKIIVYGDAGYIAAQRVKIPGAPNIPQDDSSPAEKTPHRQESNNGGNGRPGKFGTDELDHALAMAVKYKSIADILGKNGNGHQDINAEMLGILKDSFFKGINRDPIQDIVRTAGQVQTLNEVFGNKKSNRISDASPYTLDNAIAESIPDLIDIIKKKWLAPVPGGTGSSTNDKPAQKEEKMDDLFFTVRKLYEMAQRGERPEKGVTLAVSVLSQADISNFIKESPQEIIKKISYVFPDMKTFLASEKGTKWISEFHKILITAVSMSRTVSPAQKKKSVSSGGISGPDGLTRSSSVTPKTSSGLSGSGIRKPKPGLSGTGQKRTQDIPGKK